MYLFETKLLKINLIGVCLISLILIFQFNTNIINIIFLGFGILTFIYYLLDKKFSFVSYLFFVGVNRFAFLYIEKLILILIENSYLSYKSGIFWQFCLGYIIFTPLNYKFF